MRYRVKNGAARGRAFQTSAGLEIVQPGAEGVVNTASPLDNEFIAAQLAQGVRITVEADETAVLPPPADAPKDDKAALLADARALGVPADKRWGVPRLRAAITEAEKTP